MKNFYLTLLAVFAACSEPHGPIPAQNSPPQDVTYSYKKQFACKLVGESIRYESKFDIDEGRFKTQQIVVPEHTECEEVDISVCGTLTNL